MFATPVNIKRSVRILYIAICNNNTAIIAATTAATRLPGKKTFYASNKVMNGVLNTTTTTHFPATKVPVRKYPTWL